jgi:hypothetical protein
MADDIESVHEDGGGSVGANKLFYHCLDIYLSKAFLEDYLDAFY